MMREIWKLAAVLGIVCALAGASLAVVHAVTNDLIIARQERELMNKLQALVPDADRFDKEELEDGSVYYLGWQGSNRVGAILEGVANGYGGEMRLLVALDSDGNISGVEVAAHGETIGIGTRAVAASYLEQFKGISHDEQLVAGQNVDILTGVTVSSRAVMSCVNNAIELYKLHVLNIDPDDSWDLSRVADGVYEGSAPGYKDEITVKVTVASGAITAVEVVSINDTPEVYPEAVNQIPSRIVENQHWKVDAVSGATVSSDGIMAAVRAAIPDMSLKFDQIADGVYEGVGNGFGGDLKVSVEISDGAVTKITVISHQESAYVSDPALADIPAAIIEQQSVKVDAVSGATVTSQAIIEAVTNALEAAPRR